jgi:hypothetical protein
MGSNNIINDFLKYQHIERFNTSEVENIEFGKCYIFPKIDGTNASIWLGEDNNVQTGSRNRHLTIEDDNAGFTKWAVTQPNILEYLKEHPTHRLYGEWLVPHTLRTYKDSAWKNFYVFDVIAVEEDTLRYLTYEEYKPLLEKYNINYIPTISIITNGTYEQFIKQLDKNNYLIEDGKGIGEGIVIKNYEYTNKYGRKTWAKIVTSEFKEKNNKVMGSSEIKGKKLIEEEIAIKYTTKALCDKVKAKIEIEDSDFTSKQIPKLLNTVYYDLIREESWNFIKEFKNPTINYKTLQFFIFKQIRTNYPDIF